MISYSSVSSLQGPLIFVENTSDIGYQEVVKFKDVKGQVIFGQVIALKGSTAIVQSFSSTAGFEKQGATAQFLGETKKLALSPTLLGRIFDGSGNPIDGKEEIVGGKMQDVNLSYFNNDTPLPWQYRDINGAALNPYRRSEPEDFIQTGISSIDLTTTIVKGQKIPIFSGSGLPDLELLAQIATQAQTKKKDDNFVVVIAGMGISNDQYTYLKQELEKAGVLGRTLMYINLASDPVVERVLTPRMALTASEYLAFDLDFSVLTLMFDLTNYAGAMREISTAKKEIPGRSGYPGYLYTDLASLLERAGKVEGKKGSITQIPILSMPNDDVTNVVPDLVGYITEGQIFLDRKLHNKGIYPGINILSSLSRLKDKGQGEGKTREDHSSVADQVFASLDESIRQEELALILGQDSLTNTGRKYLEFGKLYREQFLNQGHKNRTVEETIDIAWNILSLLPREELKKIKDPLITKFAPQILLE